MNSMFQSEKTAKLENVWFKHQNTHNVISRVAKSVLSRVNIVILNFKTTLKPAVQDENEFECTREEGLSCDRAEDSTAQFE